MVKVKIDNNLLTLANCLNFHGQVNSTEAATQLWTTQKYSFQSERTLLIRNDNLLVPLKVVPLLRNEYVNPNTGLRSLFKESHSSIILEIVASTEFSIRARVSKT